MTAYQVELQLAQSRRFDPDVRKLSKTGIHTVNGASLVNDLFYDATRFLRAPARLRRERDMFSTFGDFSDLLEG